jgi:hypothetical protein
MPLNEPRENRPAGQVTAACPFCASPMTTTIEIDRDTWAVICNGCMAIGPHAPRAHTAALRWKTGRAASR